MAILCLEGVVAGVRVIAQKFKLTGEVGIRRLVIVFPHQLAGRRAEVGNG